MLRLECSLTADCCFSVENHRFSEKVHLVDCPLYVFGFPLTGPPLDTITGRPVSGILSPVAPLEVKTCLPSLPGFESNGSFLLRTRQRRRRRPLSLPPLKARHRSKRVPPLMVTGISFLFCACSNQSLFRSPSYAGSGIRFFRDYDPPKAQPLDASRPSRNKGSFNAPPFLPCFPWLSLPCCLPPQLGPFPLV